jgi:hypothetical protein
MSSPLTDAHQRTYDAIFRHPIARDLEWRELRGMLVALADTAEEPNGNFKITRNGHALVLHPPTRKGFSDVRELMKIRLFLSQSGGASTASAPDRSHS